MMRRKLLLASAAMIVVPFMLGCKSRKSSYFPMKEGLVFRFRVTTHNLRGDWPDNGISELTFLPVREMNGVKVFPRKAAFLPSGRSDIQFLAEDANGFYILAGQTAYDTELRLRTSPEYFIKHPIQAGTEWQTKTKFFGPEITLNARINSIDEVLTVPSGTYEHCMKVVQAGVLNDRPVEQVAWYAPGIGLVRVVIKFWQSYGGSEPTLAEIGMQLEDYKK